MDTLPSHTQLRDQECLRLIRSGGPAADAAIQQLYTLYHRSVRHACIKLLYKYPDCRSQADDLVHDSFLILLRKIRHSDQHIACLSGFWKGIGRHLLRNQMRIDERFIPIHEPETFYGPDDHTPEYLLLEKETQEQLLHIFSRLGGKCQQILMMWLNHYSAHEIGETLRISSDEMVRKQKYSCFKKLKKMITTGHKMPGPIHR